MCLSFLGGKLKLVKTIQFVIAVYSNIQIKLCRVKHQKIGKKGIPYIVTHDGRTIRYPDPLVKVNDTVKVDVSENKILDHAKVTQYCCHNISSCFQFN